MLGDISVADNIYIVTGYTDMRKSIDGLCSIILKQLQTEPAGMPFIFSAEKDVTVSKSFYESRMGMFFYTKDWMSCMENTAGPVTVLR